MNYEMITGVVDKVLSEAEKWETNTAPAKQVPGSMVDKEKSSEKGEKFWKPVISEVTDDDLKALEEQAGYPFPSSYRHFLKHKHFIELNIDSAWFFPHPAGTWKEIWISKALNSKFKDHFKKLNILPFSNYEDWGVLCFDLSKKNEENEYPVVLWDEDQKNRKEEMFPDFKTMMEELGKRQQDMDSLLDFGLTDQETDS